MKGSITKRRYVCHALATLCATLPLMVGAATTVTVKVTVVAPPPCIINGDRVIEVDFGEVIASRISSGLGGAEYMRTVDYSLECRGSTSNAMKMTIQGNPTAFDGAALQTNVPDLGIQMLINGKRQGLGVWSNFTYPDKPNLQAVPVKRGGADLSGGEFSAGATMMVDYQ